MLEAEILRAIREEVKKQVAIITNGETDANTVTTEDIANLYPGMPTIKDRPIMHPYGHVSRAPAKTLSVTARVGDHPGNRIVLGHRDKLRPEVGVGETALYDAYGNVVQVFQSELSVLHNLKVIIDAITPGLGKICVGSGDSVENLVLGQQLKVLLQTLLQTLSLMATNISTHVHPFVGVGPGNPGTTTPPATAALFVADSVTLTALKTAQVDSELILSSKAFTEKL